MTKRIADMDDMVKGYMAEYEAAVAAVDEVVGIGRRSAEVIVTITISIGNTKYADISNAFIH